MTYTEFTNLNIGDYIYEKSTGYKVKVLDKVDIPRAKRGYKCGMIRVKALDGAVFTHGHRSYSLTPVE